MNKENRNPGLNPIYVIGFPKSGNTWLARLLAETTNSNIAVFSKRDVVNAADNSVNRKSGRLIYKLHDVDIAHNIKSDKIIYIVRDVRDVLVSAFFFDNKFVSQESVRLENKSLFSNLWKYYFKRQIRRTNRRWGGNELTTFFNIIHRNKKNIQDWSYHVNYWTKQSNVTVVRYEDLLLNTENELKRILCSLSLNIYYESIKLVVSNQTFEKKKKEFQSIGDATNTSFLRNGKIGDWKNYFELPLTEEIEKKHALLMSRFGYELECFGK